MAALGQFLDEMGRLGWDWSQRDCLCWLGLWSERKAGIDGAAPWRGRYDSELGCARMLRESGGVTSCVEIGAALVGMSESFSPSVEDIGVIHAPTANGWQKTGAICTGPRWAVMTASGILTLKAEPLRAWRFP